LIGLDMATGTTQVAVALEQATKLPIVVWSQFQECTGCTVSLLQNTSPTPGQLILQQISLAYLETAMATAGAYNAKGENYTELSFDEAFKQGSLWICEGSVATKIPYAMSVAGKTSMDIVKETFPKAKATIAIGSCACFGNIQAATPDPTGAMGIREYLRTQGGMPDAAVINVSRCPANAEDLVAVITYVLVMGKIPPLDAQGRPLFLYGQTIHDNCERRGHFDAGEFVEAYGDENSAKGYCLYKVGCKGPVTYAPCAITRWNGRVSWCNASGGPCTGCSEDDFWDTMTPFSQQVPGFSFPALAGVSPATVGWVLGGVTAVGLGAHLIGQVATGRAFKGGPTVGQSDSDPGRHRVRGGQEERARARFDEEGR
jgi:hydrogenase small subunit